MDSQNILSPGPVLPGESFDLGLSDQELLDLSAREVTQMCANFSPEQIKARDSRTVSLSWYQVEPDVPQPDQDGKNELFGP